MKPNSLNQTRKLRPSNSSIEDNSLITASDIMEAVGQEVRHLRRARNLKLSELSAATGLSIGYLSQIERGLSNPSVKALHSISGALEVTIRWFFKDTEHEDPNERRFIVRADKRRQFQFEGGIKDELLSPSLSGELELLRCTFAPGAVCGYMHKGEEAGLILSGTLEFWLGDNHYILNEGDSFGFSSDEPHRWRNCGDTEAVVIWSLTPPFY